MQFESSSSFDLLGSLVTKSAIRHRNSVAFLTLRSWPSSARAEAMEAFKAEKKRKTPAIVITAACEIADALQRLLGDLVPPRAVTSVACGHSRDAECWGKTLAREVAEQVGLQFVQVFEDRFLGGSSHPKEFREAPPLVLREKPSQPVLIIDDVATSGWHLEEATLSLRNLGVPTIAAAWISGTLSGEEAGDAVTIGSLLGRKKKT